ncbi:site-specific integrase [Nodosilinea sp. FACHB-131]|uniref:site-specific integrase n=1 Tax=Cyanophyceae TaxID=3028117 RepID=UPI001685CB59|nr:site-specific integrase [Nodosilinea sp. FACHB-131]MBD1871899.1 site-specific integrase [Nodosilinea sp. FACHB-131]
MAGKKTPKELLADANARLKAAKAGVSINAVGGSLYLRSTLPPRPGSEKTQDYQQRIPLGVYFNPPGVVRAEADAMRLSSDKAMGRFSWGDWVTSTQVSTGKTVADWIVEMERQYFARRKRGPKSETTWDKDYLIPYRRLPPHRALTAELLIQTVETYEPDSRSRQRACSAYGRLAEVAGIEVNLVRYRGRYSPAAVNPRDLPTDEKIVAAIESVEPGPWRDLIALMATYGLRDHEVFYVDLKALREPPGVCIVTDGKTGWREVWPYLPEWWERFDLKSAKVPALTAKRNSDYGLRVSQWFKRRQMPFLPYDLRHAWAGRTAVMGLDPAIAAKMMGHDLSVHTRVYHQFLNRTSMQAAWERSLRRP